MPSHQSVARRTWGAGLPYARPTRALKMSDGGTRHDEGLPAPAEPDGDRPSVPLGEPFAGVVRPVIKRLLHVARRILGREDLAWDAVQEALLSLWMQDPVPPNPHAWLARAVIHRSLHLARTDRRRRKHEAVASRERLEASEHEDPSRALVAAEVCDALKSALARLNERHRSVLTLYFVDGLDYASIARREGVPVGTVRSRLSRSREALREALEKDAGAGTTEH